MTTVIWAPLPIEPLLDVQEDERNVTASVTAYEDLDSEGGGVIQEPLTSLTWSVNPPLPPQFRVTTSGTTLNVEAPDLLGSFEPVRIRFLLPPGDGRVMEYGEAVRWPDVPNRAVEIVEFAPHPVGLKTFFLTITTNTGAAAVYEIVLRANFTTGRDRMLQEVEARRKAL